MALLRKAIEPDIANPRYIETIPRIGYRFTAYHGETCDGRSVIIGLEESQLYQRFTDSQQEVFTPNLHSAPKITRYSFHNSNISELDMQAINFDD